MDKRALIHDLRNAALTFQMRTLNALLTEWRYPVLSANEVSAAKPQKDPLPPQSHTKPTE